MRILGFLFIGLVTLLSAGTAMASPRVYSGDLCNAHGFDTPSMNYSVPGINNASATVRTAWCGGAVSGPVSAVSITGYDRSVADDIQCIVSVINTGGGTLFSAAVKTAGFASGPMTMSTGAPSAAGLTTVVLQCALPAVQPANGSSYITTYTITDGSP
jgi:hypothetical protein